MHGIERKRDWEKGPEEGSGGVARIRIRYSDGRVMTVVPESNAEIYNGDDVKQLAKVIHGAASRREWAEVHERGGM